MLDLSAKADTVAFMDQSPAQSALLSDIRAFLAETGMGASYFGKASVGNSEVVKRLEDGRRVWPETEAKLREYMRAKAQEQTGGAA